MAALSGILLWSGFAPVEIWLGPYIGLFLLFRSLRNKRLSLRLIHSFIAGFTFFAPLLHWSGSYVGAAPWLALTLLQSSFFALIAFSPDKPIGFAALFTMIELVRMKIPFGGFGWGRIGFTQVDSLSWLYPTLGVTGISFLVTLFAARLNKFRTRELVALILITISTMAIALPTRSGSLKVAAVQGGVEKLGLDFNERALSVFNRHLSATKVTRDTQLVIWPENAADIDPEQNPIARDALQDLIKRINRPLLIGAVEQGQSGPRNVSILYGPDGKILSRYQKQDLAPFGEYIPIRKVSEIVAEEARLVRDFQPGGHWVKNEVGNLSFITPICFEVLDDDLVKDGASGVDLLVSQTNNATFGTSPQARQQLQIIQARASELHREFAVVSTTGFTAHIAADGKILAKLPQFKSGVLAMEITGYRGDTLASRLHTDNWLVFLGLLFLLSVRRFNR